MIATPYYNIDLSKLQKNLASLRSAFETLWPNFQIGYSYKTNNLPWLVKWMHEQGVMAEVVSEPEYELATYVGNQPNNIILNGPHKGLSNLLLALKNGSIVNLDSFAEIDFIEENIQSFTHDIKVGLRINFDLEQECPGETIPGEEPGRFGFNLENGDFDKALNRLSHLQKVKVVGLHGHHSTRTKSLRIFNSITRHLCEVSKKIPALEYLDLGGCLFGDKPGAPTFEEYASTIVDVLEAYKISKEVQLLVEPGAALIASPVSYVCSVIDVKDIKDRRLVFTDGSVKHVASQMKAPPFVSSLYTKSTNLKEKQIVTGYTCIEMDRFLTLDNQPELAKGDRITVFNVGAYTMSLTPLFIEYFPTVIVTDENGNEEVVREKWTTKEFIQKSKL